MLTFASTSLPYESKDEPVKLALNKSSLYPFVAGSIDKLVTDKTIPNKLKYFFIIFVPPLYECYDIITSKNFISEYFLSFAVVRNRLYSMTHVLFFATKIFKGR